MPNTDTPDVRALIDTLAARGAQIYLDRLRAEREHILAAFPDLATPVAGNGNGHAAEPDPPAAANGDARHFWTPERRRRHAAQMRAAWKRRRAARATP